MQALHDRCCVVIDCHALPISNSVVTSTLNWCDNIAQPRSLRSDRPKLLRQQRAMLCFLDSELLLQLVTLNCVLLPQFHFLVVLSQTHLQSVTRVQRCLRLGCATVVALLLLLVLA